MSAANQLRVQVLLLVASLLAVACSTQEGSAQKMIDDIQASINQAMPDAANYIPDQVKDVQSKLGEFKADYAKKDYQAVVSGAPAVLSAAQGLASAAAARKNLVIKGLKDQWSAFASTLPGHATEIQDRVEFFSKPANKKLGSGVDLDAVRSGLADAGAAWSRAQAEFAAGELEEAVTAAKSVSREYDALAASMKLDYTEPAAVKDTSP